jgi:hypothetical protein
MICVLIKVSSTPVKFVQTAIPLPSTWKIVYYGELPLKLKWAENPASERVEKAPSADVFQNIDIIARPRAGSRSHNEQKKFSSQILLEENTVDAVISPESI